MGDRSKIAWTDATWNPTRGCSRVSRGCENCYAERDAHRFSGKGKPYDGLTRATKHGPVWTGHVIELEEKLYQPLFWTRPRKIFVTSMSDLFHEQISNHFIAKVFAVMALARHHTFQSTTKRAERQRDFINQCGALVFDAFRILRIDCEQRMKIDGKDQRLPGRYGDALWPGWPLPNFWAGVSCEDQETVDERTKHLLQTPALVRWISLEPLLGPVDCGDSLGEMELMSYSGITGKATTAGGIDWLIVGGESGPNARPFEVEWARSIIKQCRAATTPVFIKQLGSRWAFTMNGSGFGRAAEHRYDYKGGDPEEWPEDLRIREFPNR